MTTRLIGQRSCFNLYVMSEGDLNSDGKQKCEKKINIQYSSANTS